MITHESTFKLQEFNDCNPKWVKDSLKGFDYKIVDTDVLFWKNDPATLVLCVEGLQTALELAVELRYADEVNFIKSPNSDRIFFRFWWD